MIVFLFADEMVNEDDEEDMADPSTAEPQAKKLKSKCCDLPSREKKTCSCLLEKMFCSCSRGRTIDPS